MKVFTGAVPFNNLRSDTAMIEIIEGERPLRPTDPALTDDVWVLMQGCWTKEPRSRPVMRKVLQDLASNLFWSLQKSTKPSPQFQVALSQFYDCSGRKGCGSYPHGAEPKEFVNFLEDVRSRFNRLLSQFGL